MGNDQDECRAGRKDSLPFLEGTERIGEMLNRVRGEKKIIGTGDGRAEIRGLADKLVPGLLARVELEGSAFPNRSLPDGAGRVIAVVDLRGDWIDR